MLDQARMRAPGPQLLEVGLEIRDALLHARSCVLLEIFQHGVKLRILF
jgi:hypothetical protein